jgi:hypothetical protein
MSKSNYILMFFIAALLCVVCVRECAYQKRSDTLVADISKYSGEVTKLRLENGALVSSNKSLVVQSEEQLRSITSNLNDTIKKMIAGFKKLGGVTYITNNFEAKGDSVVFEKQIPCDFKPFKAVLSDSSYVLEQTISKEGAVVDRLFVPNNVSIVFGEKKVGFMKYEHFVDVNNSNQLMVASNIKNYNFTPSKKWHETRWANMLLGAAAYSAIQTGINTLIKR